MPSGKSKKQGGLESNGTHKLPDMLMI